MGHQVARYSGQGVEQNTKLSNFNFFETFYGKLRKSKSNDLKEVKDVNKWVSLVNYLEVKNNQPQL